MRIEERNKALARRYIEEVWNRGNLDLIDELFTPDYVNHNLSAGQAPGLAGIKALIGGFRAASPDLRLTIDDLIAEGDKVVTRWTARGTHQGDLMGIPPTGKRLTVSAIVVDRFVDGRIVEHWAARDDLGMLQQLGVIPTPGPEVGDRAA